MEIFSGSTLFSTSNLIINIIKYCCLTTYIVYRAMTPTNTSLVKYDNPKLVSRSTDAKAQRKQKSPQQSPAPGVPGTLKI